MLPNNLGTYFIKLSEQIKTSNFLAHFLINFLSLLNLVKPSTSMEVTPASLACSQCFKLPITPTLNLGLGQWGNLMEPINLLSLSGS